MADYIVYLAGNICELLIMIFFFNSISTIKFRKKVFIPYFILLVIFQFVNTNLFLSKSLLILFGSYLFAFLITLMYDMKWTYRFLLSFSIIILSGLSEFLLAMLLSAVFDVNLSMQQNSTILLAFCTFTSKFLSYYFVLLVKKIKVLPQTQSVNRNIILVILLPIASFMVMILFLSCCYIINDNVFHTFAFITSIVLIFANIMVFYIIDRQNELIETKERLIFAEKHISNQTIHYQELYNYQNELRTFRHDIRHRLVSLMGLIKDNENEKAIQIMEKNLNWLNKMNDNIVNSGNPVIDAILQSKLYDAKQKGIKIDYFIRFTDEIEIDEIELGIILGNALDNAIEAVNKLPKDRDKQINFKLITTQGQISVLIKNPVYENVDTNNLFTTKEDKERHGHGINSIKTIVQKYGGLVSFSCENNIFITDINLLNQP